MAHTETVCPAGTHTCSGRCRGCQRGLGPSLPSRRASRPLTLRSALRAQGDRTACARLPPAPSSLILPPSPDAERHIRKCSNDSACILRISCTGAIAGHRERLRSPQCRAATTSDETQPGRAPRQRVGEPSEHLRGLENPPGSASISVGLRADSDAQREAMQRAFEDWPSQTNGSGFESQSGRASSLSPRPPADWERSLFHRAVGVQSKQRTHCA